jgi:cell division protein ZapA (FtsZ GTPase activity inhibitor)
MLKGQPIEIRLLGQRIPLKSSETDEGLVREVVAVVTERIRDAEKRSKGASAAHQVILLALLDLAAEYVKAKRKTQDFQRQMNDKAEKLLSILESH